MDVELTLERLVQRFEGVEEAVAVTPDGFVVGFYPKNREESSIERISAMGASLLSLAQRMAESFSRGSLKELVLKTSEGVLVGYPLSSELFVFVWVKR